MSGKIIAPMFEMLIGLKHSEGPFRILRLKPLLCQT